MNLSPRHRKASPKPPIRHPSPINISEPKSGGIGSYLATARRRWIPSSRDTDTASTLLPTTYSSVKSSAPSKRSSSNSSRQHPTSRTCNSFLMGGHYYPGKDKKRKSMRRKTLWYKIFCSSSWRKVASTVMVIYILFWHALVPMTEWVLQIGQTVSRTSKNPIGDWLQFDASLVVPSLADERSAVIHSASERARLQYGPEKRHENRLQLLEAIAPAWFHRNDANFGEKTSADEPVNRDKALTQHEIEDHSHITDKKVEQGGPESKTKKEGEQKPKKEMQQPVEKKSGKKPTGEAVSSSSSGEVEQGGADSKTKEKPKKKKGEQKPESEHIEKKKEASLTNNTGRTRSLTVTGNDRPLLTLQTMDSVGTNYSSCPSQISEQEWKITLVTQFSIDRLWILKETCTRWKDPIVAVVLMPSDMTPGQRSAWESFSSVTCPQLQLIQYIGTEEESKTDHYPVNRLRNIGLDAVNTSHILVADVDFVPSKRLDKTIRLSLKQLHSYVPEEAENHQAVIVPAFERKPPTPCESESQCAQYLQAGSSFIPHTFEELGKCVGSKDCIVFQSDNNWEGHHSTNSEDWLQKKWYEDEEQKHLKQLECFHSMRYEPYVVIRWCPSSSSKPVAPHYDERFYGYGKNKIELISHLRSMGYQFSILPEGFIVHNPHPESPVKETWNDREGSELHATMDKLYPKFLKELYSKYKQFSDSIVKPCEKKEH